MSRVKGLHTTCRALELFRFRKEASMPGQTWPCTAAISLLEIPQTLALSLHIRLATAAAQEHLLWPGKSDKGGSIAKTFTPPTGSAAAPQNSDSQL